ncbi:MAG TPA: hypothetical protein VGB89_12725 [Bacteroidota bacterium]
MGQKENQEKRQRRLLRKELERTGKLRRYVSREQERSFKRRKEGKR